MGTLGSISIIMDVVVHTWNPSRKYRKEDQKFKVTLLHSNFNTSPGYLRQSQQQEWGS